MPSKILIKILHSFGNWFEICEHFHHFSSLFPDRRSLGSKSGRGRDSSHGDMQCTVKLPNNCYNERFQMEKPRMNEDIKCDAMQWKTAQHNTAFTVKNKNENEEIHLFFSFIPWVAYTAHTIHIYVLCRSDRQKRDEIKWVKEPPVYELRT